MGRSGPSLGMGVTVLLQRPMQNIGGLGTWQPQKTQRTVGFYGKLGRSGSQGAGWGALGLEQKEPGHGGQAHLSSKSTVVGTG